MASITDTIPTSQETSNGSHPPHRLLLVSVPRTASNLLVKILNIHHQPNVLTNEQAGYFFYHGYMTLRDLDLQKPIDQWTDADPQPAQLCAAYQQCLDRLEEASARAREDGKIMFAKEHAFWLVNQSAMPSGQPTFNGQNGNHPPPSPSPPPLRLTFPSTPYGPPQNHTYTPLNPTWFPDQYLRTWQLAFIIRHPALAWPSLYRAMHKMTTQGLMQSDIDDSDGLRGTSLANMSLAWTRRLFDWGVEQQQQENGSGSNGSGNGAGGGGRKMPLVIDAHDVIHSPGAVRRFCEAAGLEVGEMQWEWDAEKDKKDSAAGKFEAREAAKIMLETLDASKGVVKEKTPATVDIKAEAEKWRVEFGEETAGMIEKMVWDAMPDYEYLRERRVQA